MFSNFSYYVVIESVNTFFKIHKEVFTLGIQVHIYLSEVT